MSTGGSTITTTVVVMTINWCTSLQNAFQKLQKIMPLEREITQIRPYGVTNNFIALFYAGSMQ